MTRIEKKLVPVGPGGMKCSCCFPAPGSKERRKLFRRAIRKVKQMMLREGLQEAE